MGHPYREVSRMEALIGLGFIALAFTGLGFVSDVLIPWLDRRAEVKNK